MYSFQHWEDHNYPIDKLLQIPESSGTQKNSKLYQKNKDGGGIALFIKFSAGKIHYFLPFQMIYIFI